MKRILEDTEHEVLKKYKKRDKRKIEKMKVSGKSVVRLKRIISEKNQELRSKN